MSQPNDDDTPIWGLKNIAKEIGLTVNQAYPKIKNGLIPARQIGVRNWVSTKGELRRLVRGETA